MSRVKNRVASNRHHVLQGAVRNRDVDPNPFPEDLAKFFAPNEQKLRYIYRKMIPKRSGGLRTILVPTGKLRAAQDLALSYLMHKSPDSGEYPVSMMNCQMAYRRGVNAYQNACKHDGYRVSVKLDISDFFDSIPAFPRKACRKRRGILRKLKLLRRQTVNANAKVLDHQNLTRKRVVVLSVEEALLAEGIRPNVAKWISDVGSLNGYLYQGSPLSPVLSNLVAKHLLCRRMLAIAARYSLPIFTVKGRWSFVLDDSTRSIVHEASADPAELECLVRATGYLTSPLCQVGEESAEDALVRVANSMWRPARRRRPSDMRRNICDFLYKVVRKAESPPAVLPSELKHHRAGLCVFTIYADDIVFSSNNHRLIAIKHYIARVLTHCGFSLNRKKRVKVSWANPHITGYVTGPCPEESKDKGARISKSVRLSRYRAPLHNLKTGKLPLTAENIRTMDGRLAYLRLSNPEWHKIYATELYDIVQGSNLPDEDKSIVAHLERFKDGVVRESPEVQP